MEYQTKDYVNGGSITKTVFVYLPAGYDASENASKKYDVLYFMHGYSGTAHELLAFEDGADKNILDHLIAKKRIKPLIVVTATWNVSPDTPTDNLEVWGRRRRRDGAAQGVLEGFQERPHARHRDEVPHLCRPEQQRLAAGAQQEAHEPQTHHAVYYVLKGAAHDFEGYQRYLYKALRTLYAR